VHADDSDDNPVPTAMTCGVPEENLANNQRMAESLSRLGYPVGIAAVRDAHNYTAWRDALHPHLTGLVNQVVAARAA
jgi:enterochelin esterase family protein